MPVAFLENAFERQREAVKDVEVMYLDDTGLGVFTGASGYMMGECLMHDQFVNGVEQKQVTAKVFKTFSVAEQKYSMTEYE